MKNYEIGLWPGSGYFLHVLRVAGDCEEQALERLAAKLIGENLRELYLTSDEVADAAARVGADEYEWAEECNLLYIDGTMEGAAFPVYLRGENLRIREVA